MSVPSPIIIQELIDQLLPTAPSTSAPLHLLPKLQGLVSLLRYWNAHLCSEIRRASRAKSIQWEKLEEKDRRILKRMSNVRCEKDLDEKGEAFLLILASWHIQHHLMTNPRAHQHSLRLVNLWFPPSPLPSSYFIGEPSVLDPKTVHATNTKFAKFRTNALVKVQGVRKIINRTEGSVESLAKALRGEAEAPTTSFLRFDLRLQWESESTGLSNWAKKVVQLWMLMDRLFPSLPEEALSKTSPHREEVKNIPIHTSVSVPHRVISDSTILSFSTPDHSIPPQQRSGYPHTNDSTYTPSTHLSLPTTSTKTSPLPIRSNDIITAHAESISDLESRSRHFPSSSSLSISPFIKPQATASLDDFVADSQPFDSLPPSYSFKKTNTTDISLENISDIEIISPRATSRVQPVKPLISSPPSTTLGSRRKSGGRPRLSFEPDFDLSVIPPEPQSNVKPRLYPEGTADSSSKGLPVNTVSAIRDARPPVDHKDTLPRGQQRAIELISSSPIDDEAEDDESLPVADSQEIIDDKPANEQYLDSVSISPARSLPRKAATAFSFPDLSPRMKRAHRSLLYLPNHHGIYSSSSGSDSDPISDSSDDDSQDDLVGLNHRTIVRASGTNSIGQITRQAEVISKRKRDTIKDESEESEDGEERFRLRNQMKIQRLDLKVEEKNPDNQLRVFTQGGRAGSLEQSTSLTTSSSAFDSEILDSSFSAGGRDSESESAVSSLIADDPTYSSSDREEDTTATTTITVVTGSIEVQDSQEMNSSLGYM
ncbi:hypothetical protein [Phaffia rhodozyma]|uniref:Uncharacterized protein n=1 Tax=Phaffia rhodozyma TaxID=264483 RepID=A0A0F7SM75_PHARH|nr:hypothetical protein [Phaffia rhodozyma]